MTIDERVKGTELLRNNVITYNVVIYPLKVLNTNFGDRRLKFVSMCRGGYLIPRSN